MIRRKGLQKGKSVKGIQAEIAEKFDPAEVSLCPNCYCMTHTVKGLCGKCGGKK